MRKGVFNICIDEVEVRIEMLGGFTITYDGARITKQVKKSSKIWKLLQYLIAHRHKSVYQEELMEIFCDGELVGNPGSALRTMVYRARAALADSGLPHADDLIVSKDGGYAWNPSVQCAIDAEEFESLCKRANTDACDEARLGLLLKAAELYKGDFLPNSSGDMWVMPLSRWYRSLYVSCVHDALELLSGAGRAAEAEALCAKALRLDPYDEKMLEYHLRSLMAQGKSKEALDEYRRMEHMFYDTLGVSFSDSLRALHSQIQRPAIKEGAPLDAMLGEWLDGAGFPGAYYCDLSLFKAMLQIESRSVPRSGRTAYIVRIEAKHEPNAKGGGVMKQLGKIIPGMLRMGDLYTQASPNQYMLMLHSLTYENCKDLINRILHSLDAKYLPKIVGTTIRHVKPFEQH
jgi:DNA-binding SARP family transcriptional activator